jgi:hypothetical protein
LREGLHAKGQTGTAQTRAYRDEAFCGACHGDHMGVKKPSLSKRRWRFYI